MSFVLAIISLLLTAFVTAASVISKGNTGLFHAALGTTAVVMSFMGLWFTFLSLTEREKNRLFSYIGGAVSFLLCVVWVIIIVKGQA